MFRKGDKWFFRLDSHHLPVSGHGIFSIACLSETGITSHRFCSFFHVSSTVEIQHSQLLQVGDLQGSHLIQDMSKSIYPYISELFRIRHSSDTQRIQDNHKNSVVLFHLRLPLSIIYFSSNFRYSFSLTVSLAKAASTAFLIRSRTSSSRTPYVF